LKVIKTYIVCLDDHRNFSEDIKKRFSDSSKYIVSVTHNREDFLKSLGDEKGPDIFRVAIIGLHDSKDSYEYTGKIIADLKAYDKNAGVLLLAPPDKLDDVRNSLRVGVDSYIPKNANTVLRVHNTVKKLVSEHNLMFYNRRRKISVTIVIALLVLSLFFLLASRLLLPDYF